LVFKNQGKKSAKTRKLGFLKNPVHRVGEKAENQVFWLDFCAKKEL
jgi:hypothetical protein